MQMMKSIIMIYNRPMNRLCYNIWDTLHFYSKLSDSVTLERLPPAEAIIISCRGYQSHGYHTLNQTLPLPVLKSWPLPAARHNICCCRQLKNCGHRPLKQSSMLPMSPSQPPTKPKPEVTITSVTSNKYTTTNKSSQSLYQPSNNMPHHQINKTNKAATAAATLITAIPQQWPQASPLRPTNKTAAACSDERSHNRT